MKRLDIVCYTSKLCNLRCRYCYELPLLGDRTRMSLDAIERMFTNVALGFRGSAEPIAINFYWHGGEPLLIPPAFYRQVFDLQRRVFSDSVHRVTNSIQSNFTVIDDDRIALLREFDGVGVSLDLFGGLRVDLRGRNSEARALANLARVREAGIAVAGITVLSRANVAHVRGIYEFYRSQRMRFRILPIEQGLYADGQPFELGPHEVLAAYCDLLDLWLEDDDPVAVKPLDRFLCLVIHANRRASNRVDEYDPTRWPSALLVDTDGTVYTYGDRFGRRTGSLFETPLDRLLAGDGYRQTALETRQRMQRTCERCEYYRRACMGDPVGESCQDFVEYDADGSVRCIVARGVIRHLERRLRERGTLADGSTHDEARVLAGRVDFAVA
jgi:uncharacterized protein